VIVPVYQDWTRLALCLEALERQTLPADRFEIIIADNEPEPRGGAVRLPANARVVHQPLPGSYAARNLAISASRGQYLAFTDSDCIPCTGWLEHGLRLMAAHPGSRVTGPVPIFRELGTSYSAYLYDYHTAFKQKESARAGRCATANLLVPRNIFDSVGAFDERLVSAGDADWNERAQGAGIPLIYDEDLAVSHPARRSVDEILRKRRRKAGAVAQRKSYPTYRFFLYRLLPPFRHFYLSVIGFKRGPLRPLDWPILFFVHWLGQMAEGLEFLSVRKGWKQPNRT
jgi:GT2 family glycosyltransferase